MWDLNILKLIRNLEVIQWRTAYESSGAVWKLQWPSWAFRPNEPYSICGLKVKTILDHAPTLVSTCPLYVNQHPRTLSNTIAAAGLNTGASQTANTGLRERVGGKKIPGWGRVKEHFQFNRVNSCSCTYPSLSYLKVYSIPKLYKKNYSFKLNCVWQWQWHVKRFHVHILITIFFLYTTGDHMKHIHSYKKNNLDHNTKYTLKYDLAFKQL